MSSKIKLIIEKGPREGETLEYNSTSVIKIGRVVRGNTIAIKDAGISSKHISIQFDNQLLQWTVIDLDSSNGTILNGVNVKPRVSSCLSDGDCITIGELTSVIVRIGTDLEVEGPSGRRNTRRNGKGVAVVESDLGLGFDERKAAQKRNLRPRGRKVAVVVENDKEKAVEDEVEVVQKQELRGRGKKGVGMESEKGLVEEDVQKRGLRVRGKKGVDVKVEVESLSCMRVLRSSKKGKKMNVDVIGGEDVSVLMEPKKTRGGRKKLPAKVVKDSDLDGSKLVETGVPVEGKRTGRGRLRKKMAVESLEDNDAKKSVQVGEGNEGDLDKGTADLLKVENIGLVDNLDDANNELVQDHLVEKLDTNNDCFQDDLAEKLVLRQEGCEGKEEVVDGRLIKTPSVIPDLDEGKKLPVRGIPNTNTKYREDKKVKWHDTPFETILERALNREAAKASSRVGWL